MPLTVPRKPIVALGAAWLIVKFQEDPLQYRVESIVKVKALSRLVCRKG